jgi:hypothetical protein
MFYNLGPNLIFILWRAANSFVLHETLNNLETTREEQGCQMVYFQAKNPNLGKFWRALDWKMFTYLMAIRNI